MESNPNKIRIFKSKYYLYVCRKFQWKDHWYHAGDVLLEDDGKPNCHHSLLVMAIMHENNMYRKYTRVVRGADILAKLV